MDLANEHKRSDFRFLYDLDEPLSTKIEKIATEIYGADSVVYSKDALKRSIQSIRGFWQLAYLYGKDSEFYI
jgi:formyltetrahydrofolate synthetase